MLPLAMLRTLALLPLLLVACKSSGGSGSVPPPSGSDAGVSSPVADAGEKAAAAPSAAYQEVVGGASLPRGQLLQLGAPRRSHPGIARQVALTSTGAILSAGLSHVRLWDPVSGALRWQVFTPSSRTCFALSNDEKWIAIYQGDLDRGRVSVHELGGALRYSLDTDAVSSLAFSPDGTVLAVASSVTSLQETATGKLLKTLKGLAFSVGFAADDQVIAVGKERVLRWNGPDDAQGETLATVPRSSRISAMAQPASTVAWSNGTTVEVMTLGSKPIKIDSAAPAAITALALSASGDSVLIGWPGGMAAWDLAPALVKRWQIATPYKALPAVAFAKSGKLAVAADARGVFTLDAATGKVLTQDEDRLHFLGFAADGNLVVEKGNAAHLMEVRTGALGAAHGRPDWAPQTADNVLYGSAGLGVAWDSIAQDECKPLTVWLSSKESRTVRTPSGCGRNPWDVGPGFVVATGSKTTIWDLVENKPRLILPATDRPRIGLAFSADRRWMVTAHGPSDATSSSDERGTFLAVFDLAAATTAAPASPVRELEWTGAANLLKVAILADGTIIAGTAEGAVYEAAPGQNTFEVVTQLGAEIVRLEAAPSGKIIAATNEDGLTAILEP